MNTKNAVLGVLAGIASLSIAGGAMAQYTLTISGNCPGNFTLAWSGATPNAQQAIIAGDDIGHFTIPSGYPCAGTTLGLMGHVRQAGQLLNTGPDGSGQINGTSTPFACRHHFQLLELGSCNTSNVTEIP